MAPIAQALRDSEAAVTDDELQGILETLRWLAYLQAWTDGYIAGGGDRNATDIPQRADRDYQKVKATWGQAPPKENP